MGREQDLARGPKHEMIQESKTKIKWLFPRRQFIFEDHRKLDHFGGRRSVERPSSMYFHCLQFLW